MTDAMMTDAMVTGAMQSAEPLRHFLAEMTGLIEDDLPEPQLLQRGGAALGTLIAQDGWLPDAYTQADPVYYRQYLLYCDPRERFSVVSFVWGPGQQTPVHDHEVWGLIGMYRGAEIERRFLRDGGKLTAQEETTLLPGMVAQLTTADRDIHHVRNAFADQTSISIHVYGGNIGRIRRSVYDPETGAAKTFVSSYSNATLPNVWA